MPTYETLFITPPNLAEDEELAAVDTLAQVVLDGGGEMICNERMGRRRLAYPIGRFDDGVYVRFLYESGTAVSRELDRRIRLSDKVLRSLTVRLEPDWAADAREEVKRAAERRALAAEEEAQRAAAALEAGAAGAGEPSSDAESDQTDRGPARS